MPAGMLDNIINFSFSMQMVDEGTSEGDSAAAAAADLPKRSPLTQRGLTKQQWAELQHQKATKPPRKALSFQYPAGRPVLPLLHMLSSCLPSVCLCRMRGEVDTLIQQASHIADD